MTRYGHSGDWIACLRNFDLNFPCTGEMPVFVPPRIEIRQVKKQHAPAT
jgi:hypothetical protein